MKHTVEFGMVEYFLKRATQYNVHSEQEIRRIYEEVLYTRKFYQSLWRMLIVPLFLFFMSVIINNNLPRIPYHKNVAEVIFVAAGVIFVFFLWSFGRSIYKAPELNGFCSEAARDIMTVMKTFRSLTGKYPQQLGQEEIHRLLKKTARRVDLYNRTNRPEKAQEERRWLRAVYDAAQEFIPVPSYEKLFS